MIGDYIIGLPTDGINATDAPFEIDENQAQAMVNLRIVGNGMESIRPSTNFNAYIDFVAGYSPTNNDVVVFRNRDRSQTEYLFAHAGKVYRTSSMLGLAVGNIGYNGNPNYRIRLVVFKNQVFIFNGKDENYKYDGTNLWTMGIDPPDTDIEIILGGGSLTRNYFYTYYNSVDETESNPDNGAISSACVAENVSVKVVASTNPQVDTIRIYRTGEGIVVPRLCKEVSNTTATVLDDSTDGDTASGISLRFDHDTAPILSDGIVHNNRLFGWGGINDEDDTPNNDVVWISNEYEPQYMPVVPFIDQTDSSSGGPIMLNPGDGGSILDVVPWGGAVIALKDTAVYRIQETEVGFYGYQVMSIPPAIAPRSARVTSKGMIYLTANGLTLLDTGEQISHIGYPIKYYTDLIDSYDTMATASAYGSYIISFENALTSERQTFIYDTKNGWSGPHTVLGGTSYFTDIDGSLYEGRSDRAGMAKSNLNIIGTNLLARRHDPIPINFLDKAREFTYGKYSRIREAKVYGQIFATIPETMDFNVYDENKNLLDENEISITRTGVTAIGIGNSANLDRMACSIAGVITSPVRITKIGLLVETGARVQE